MIVTVTALAVHALAGTVVAVVNVRTGLTPDVPETREAQGIDNPTRETVPIVVVIGTLATQNAESLLVDILMPLDEILASTPAPTVKPQIVTEKVPAVTEAVVVKVIEVEVV